MELPWGQNVVLIEQIKDLRNLAKPVGISSCVTKFVESLPPALRGNLPSPKVLEAELKRDDLSEGE